MSQICTRTPFFARLTLPVIGAYLIGVSEFAEPDTGLIEVLDVVMPAPVDDDEAAEA